MASRFDDDDSGGGGGGAGRGRARRGMTIPPLVECETVRLQWTGRAPPFRVTVHDADDPDGPPLMDFGETTDTGVGWSVNVPADTEVVFALVDGAGGEPWVSDEVDIPPGPNCPPRTTSPAALPGVFSTSSTSYGLFTSASSITSASDVASSTSSSITSSAFTSTTSSESATPTSSMSTSSAPLYPSSETTAAVPAPVQTVTLTQTPTLATEAGDLDLAQSTASPETASLAKESDGPSTGAELGVGLGVTLGLGLPVLLIYLAYWCHRRKSQQVEERYASFSDLHSRPASVHTTRSFYSLGLPDDHHSIIEEKPEHAPPVPPIPAAYAPSLDLPYRTSPAAGDTFMGCMSRWQHTGANEQYTLEPPPAPAATRVEESDESVYGGMAAAGQRDSMSTLDAQRWIDEYVERRETFRGGVSVLGRPHSHGVV